MQVFTNFIDSIFLDLVFIVEIRPIFKALASYWTFKYENNIEFIRAAFTVQGNISKHGHFENTKNKEWIIVSNFW